jgi:hypothetical protein
MSHTGLFHLSWDQKDPEMSSLTTMSAEDIYIDVGEEPQAYLEETALRCEQGLSLA